MTTTAPNIETVGPLAHTPGPWRLTTSDPPGQWVIYSAVLRPGTRGHQDAGRYVGSEANARLIAAAPDLFAALEDIANWLVCSSIASAEDMAQSFEAMSKKAEAALAKARGET